MTVVPADYGGTLVDRIADQEGRIENLVRWARAVRDLGGCSHDVSPDGLAAIGDAMLADASEAKAGWQSCFDIACALRSHDRQAAQPPALSPSGAASSADPPIPQDVG